MLVEPEIPQNTGNVARTCAATGSRLHLVHPLGFKISDRHLKRAGMDYWYKLEIVHYQSLDEFLERQGQQALFLATTKAPRAYTEVSYPDEAFLVFGKESAGLPESFLRRYPSGCVRIPMRADLRSLNLSSAAAVLTYEALRQRGFAGLEEAGQPRSFTWNQVT